MIVSLKFVDIFQVLAVYVFVVKNISVRLFNGLSTHSPVDRHI